MNDLLWVVCVRVCVLFAKKKKRNLSSITHKDGGRGFAIVPSFVCVSKVFCLCVRGVQEIRFCLPPNLRFLCNHVYKRRFLIGRWLTLTDWNDQWAGRFD